MEAPRQRVTQALHALPDKVESEDLASIGLAAARLVAACTRLEAAAYAKLGDCCALDTEGANEEDIDASAVLQDLLPLYILALCLDGEPENARFAYLRAESCTNAVSAWPDAGPAVAAAQALMRHQYAALFRTLENTTWHGEAAKVAAALAAKTRRSVWDTFRRSHARITSLALAKQLGLPEKEALEQARAQGWHQVPLAADVMETEASLVVLERAEQPEDHADVLNAQEAAARATSRIQSLVEKVLTLEQPASFDTRGVVEATLSSTTPSSNNRQGSG
ncbi:Hypothetical Protein FCC1311_098962 [Hondaea fermentalgiana]|uniref:CSN8/PSMD8/EIF3K domain-containing protein n=1 Tax=Hondaea fermentalgiana TaxID=2315210 RepID=A0A2R5GY74_9STRA|nr:Hypothetical Protein FCC1311_098962 [Hondaea fermentalgiana]|eukprot:GBG33673.1 Hypothetical Protein FCC1311_098962 [Hondaea fermentalgiana]